MRTLLLGALLASTILPSLAHAQSAPSAQPIVVTVLPSPAAPLAPAAPMVESTRANWSLLAPGVGLLAGGWLIGWLTTVVWNLASAQCHGGSTGGGFVSGPTLTCDPPLGPYGEGDWQMAIPIVGPFLTFIGDDTFRGADLWFPIGMAALQITGVALLIAGIASPQHVTRPAPGAPQVQVGLGTLGVTMSF